MSHLPHHSIQITRGCVADAVIVTLIPMIEVNVTPDKQILSIYRKGDGNCMCISVRVHDAQQQSIRQVTELQGHNS